MSHYQNGISQTYQQKKRENNLRVIVLDNGAEKARQVNISFQFIL